MDEMKEIYRLRKTLNLTLKQAHGDCIEGSYWLSGRRNGIDVVLQHGGNLLGNP